MKLCRLLLILAVSLMAYWIALLATMYPRAVMVFVIILGVAAARKGYRRLTTLGSARWAGADDLEQAGMLDAQSGLILGRITDSRSKLWPALKGLFNRRLDAAVACGMFLGSFRKPPDRLVRLSKAVHTAVFAPTGVGKGVSCVVPFLQTCPDACVVVDFKGELAKLTSQHRREVFGHKIRILDPFKVVTQTPAKLNLLDSIDPDSRLAVDDCRDLAAAIVVRTGDEREPQWNDSAEAWIAAMVGCVVRYGENGQRSLQTVRTLLSDPGKMQKAIELMCKSDAFEGMLSRMGHGLTRYVDRELGSTLTTTNKHLRFLDTIAIAESTSGSSFDPAELRDGKTTVYLVLPPEHFRAQSGLLRLWITALLRAVVRGGLQEKKVVHYVLDEAASLGHLEPLDDAVDKYRGYGVRLQFYYQSIGQLQKCWPKGGDQTLLSNCSTVWFGINDNGTAKYVSERLGQETIWVDGSSTTRGWSSQMDSKGGGSNTQSGGGSSEWKQQARSLLNPDEVMNLDPRIAITFTPGLPAICTRLIRYYEEPKLGRLPGPLHGMWTATKTAAACVMILAAAVLGTVWLTQIVNEQSNRAVQYVMPGVPAQR